MVKITLYNGTPCIQVKVVPRASQNQIVGTIGEALKIKIKAPPEKGKANEELICFLKKLFNCPKQDISLVQGKRAKTKLIAFANYTEEELQKRLDRILVKK